MKPINLENIQEVVAAIHASIRVTKKEAPVGLYEIDAALLYHEQIKEVLLENFEGFILTTERGIGKLGVLFTDEFLDYAAPKIKEQTGRTDSLEKIKDELFLNAFGSLMPTSPSPKRRLQEFPFESPFDKKNSSLN